MPDRVADQAFYCTVSGRVFEVWVHLRALTRHNSASVGLKSDLPSNYNYLCVSIAYSLWWELRAPAYVTEPWSGNDPQFLSFSAAR